MPENLSLIFYNKRIKTSSLILINKLILKKPILISKLLLKKLIPISKPVLKKLILINKLVSKSNKPNIIS
jgi:hypothetical protein